MTEPKKPLLEIKDLHTRFHTLDGVVKAVDGIDFEVYPGETLGLVGESGCGKSITAMSVMQLIQSPPGKIVDGEIWLHRQGGQDRQQGSGHHQLGVLHVLADQAGDPAAALAALAAGFVIKLGAFGVHIWLPDTYAEADDDFTAIMSAVVSKQIWPAKRLPNSAMP